MVDKLTDFNDLHIVSGLKEVLAQVNVAKQGKLEAMRQPAMGEVELGVETEGRLVKSPLPKVFDGGIKNAEVAAHGESSGNWEDGLRLTQNGGIRPMVSNIVLILSNDDVFTNGLAYCDLSYRILKQRKLLPNMLEGEWTDADTSHVLNWLGLKYGFDPGNKKLAEALVVAAQKNRFHPVKNYLFSLKWDGVERLNTWLVEAFNAKPKNNNKSCGFEYLKLAGRYFLLGAIARVMQPPVKMDTVLILEGRQGEGKSTAVKVLFGDWFSDSPIPIGSKDAYQVIQGIWGHEQAELDSFNKAESTSAKMFFSSESDRYRPSYGLMAQNFPRQCVFVGTTNQDEYLKDYTGNRRYWPVFCEKINVAALRKMRDQLWAEALHFYRQGEDKNERGINERWWPDVSQKILFEAEQDARLQVDPWQHYVEDYLYKNEPDYVTSAQVLSEAINKQSAGVTRADQNRLSPIMHALGWVNVKKRILVEGSKQKQSRHVYVRPRNWNSVKLHENGAPFIGEDEDELEF